jgi:hypothetical protein
MTYYEYRNVYLGNNQYMYPVSIKFFILNNSKILAEEIPDLYRHVRYPN